MLLPRRDLLRLAAGSALVPAVAQQETPPSAPKESRTGAQLPSLRFRQIHLDFHTSEAIGGVGNDFDPDDFASTLERARVNSVTCFARCHHGWMYYDSKLFPERRHPNLHRNLLAEQIAACHKRGIRVPIYTTAMWDHYSATRHPEWLQLDEKGTPIGTPLYEAGFYRKLCLNSEYRKFFRAHLQEILEGLPADGLFIDIVHPQDCNCLNCRSAMMEQGMDPSHAAARRAFGLRTMNQWVNETTRFIRTLNRDCTIFYNAGHVGPKHSQVISAYTHFELESLPSGGWGYLDFPLKARFTRTLGIESLGMTGKFHTFWGDFHSFKNQAALEFECFHMLALGAKCSVGDQLHPTGKIDPYTYELIGTVYRQVEEKEPWCVGATPVSDIAIFTPEEFLGGSAQSVPDSAFGATRMFQEAGHQFDIIDSSSDLSHYRLLVLPDNIQVAPSFAAKLEAFVSQGGALLASYESGLTPESDRFALECLGLDYKGAAAFSPDFIVPRGAIGSGLPPTEHVMYRQGKQVEPRPGTEVLATVDVPYFNRTWQHFCSHRQTPSSGRPAYPGIVRRGRAIYFMHPVFAQYQENAPRWVKKMVMNAVAMLLPEPLLRVEAPSSTIVSLTEQQTHGRYVLHLLHYVPERRGREFDVIEDVIPLFNVKISAQMPRAVKRVLVVPGTQELPFTTNHGRTEFILPRLHGHQMIELRYES